MTQKVERFESYKTLLNTCYLVGFGLFLGVQTLDSVTVLPAAVRTLQLFAIPLMLLWSAGLWRYAKAVRADKALACALGDELNLHLRSRVIIITFWALVMTQAVILTASVFATFSAETAADLTLFVMAMSLGAAPLYLSRE